MFSGQSQVMIEMKKKKKLTETRTKKTQTLHLPQKTSGVRTAALHCPTRHSVNGPPRSPWCRQEFPQQREQEPASAPPHSNLSCAGSTDSEEWI